MQPDAERAEQEAAAPAERRDGADRPRADVLEPLAGDRRREAEEHDRDGEDPDDVRAASSRRRPASRPRTRGSAAGLKMLQA